MTILKRLGASVSVLAVAAVLGAAPAHAAGTPANSTITNNVTVSYQVGGVAQNPITASNSFTVDRKIDLVVAEVGTVTTTVSPGQTAAVTVFQLSNTSNATLDFELAATNRNGGTAAHGGTDSFDVGNIRMFVDTNGNASYDAGVDQQVAYLDQVAADSNIRIFVVADIPLGQATGAIAGVRLTATAAEGTAAGSLGTVISETAGANTAAMDTVFADTNASGNTARDGISFAEDDYTVSAAALTVTKTSRVVSDPFNNITNPKMIPGAVIEYCITVANAAGSATASNVAISDTLPGQTTYEPGFGVKVNGTVTGGTCNADGAIAGNHASGVVTGTIPSVAGSATRTVLFRATVN